MAQRMMNAPRLGCIRLPLESRYTAPQPHACAVFKKDSSDAGSRHRRSCVRCVIRKQWRARLDHQAGATDCFVAVIRASQAEHHRTRTFQDELIEFLKRHHVQGRRTVFVAMIRAVARRGFESWLNAAEKQDLDEHAGEIVNAAERCACRLIPSRPFCEALLFAASAGLETDGETEDFDGEGQ